MNKKKNKNHTGKPGPGSNRKDSRLQGSNQKKPKTGFNFYWIYALIAIIFFGIQFFNWGSGPAEITWKKFEQEMLSKHEVEGIVIVNNELVEVYIKQELLKNEKYTDLSTKTICTGIKTRPHYFIYIGSPEIFYK